MTCFMYILENTILP